MSRTMDASATRATDGSRDRPLTPAQVDGAGQVLSYLREHGAAPVSELAAAMQTARSTVLQRLEFLSAAELVRVSAQVTGQRGRPASRYVFDPKAGHALVAHVGLTGCRTAITDLGGEVLADRLDPVDLADGPAGLIGVIEQAFARLLRSQRLPRSSVAGIGVGLPSTLEMRGFARSLGAAGSDWDRGHLEQALSERYRVRVFSDLDVNLLALAEHRTSWPDSEVLVCAKLGTLIDAALVVRGVPVRGVSGLAGELGHIKVGASATPCACGGTGCLDAVASGQALVAQLAAAGLRAEHVSDVVRLSADGVPQAVQATREAGRAIGEALSSVVNLLNPGAISVWGYLADSEPLMAGLRESVYRLALPGSSERLEVVRTALGDQAGVRGAAMSVIDQVLEPGAIDKMLLAGSWSP